MLTELTETLWLHRQYTFSLAELSELSGLNELELRDMVDAGILEPIEPEASPWLFGADRLLTVRMACRLSRDFDLDPQSLALAVSLLERIHALEAEVLELRAKLPHAIF
jgi:chaperone modulatory protein CbpM